MPRNLTIILAAVLIVTVASMAVTKYVYGSDIPEFPIIAAAIIFAIAIMFCFISKFTISIYDDRIEITHILRKVTVKFEEIIEVRIGELNVIKNYSNWTLKGVKYRTYSAVGEDMGVGLKITGKRVIYLSTKDPEALAAALPKGE